MKNVLENGNLRKPTQVYPRFSHKVSLFSYSLTKSFKLDQGFHLPAGLKNSVVEVQPLPKKIVHHDHVIPAMVLNGTVQVPGRLSSCKIFSTVCISVMGFLNLKPS